MNDTETEMAVYSHAAMQGSPSLAQRVLNEYGYDSSTVVPDLTDFDVTTIQREDGSFVLAGKGTTETQEWFRDNSQIAFNLHDIRRDYGDVNDASDVFNKMNHRYQDLQEKYGEDVNVHLTGHSRGGSMALSASRRLGKEATVFNPGAGVMSYLRGSACRFIPCDESQRTIFTIQGDILSTGIGDNLYGQNEVHKKLPPHPTLPYHTILQFLPSKKKEGRDAVLPASNQSDREFCQLYPHLCKDGKVRAP